MNVPQAVRLVVAEMSHCPRKAAAENTLAVSEYSRKSGNPLIKAKVMARKSVLPGCIKKWGDRECGSLTSPTSPTEGVGNAKVLKSLGHSPKGRHYRG